MRERAGTRASAGWIKRRAAVSRLKLDLADAETKRDALQKELAAVPATLSVERAPQVIVTGGRLTPIDERLQEVRRNLDSLTESQKLNIVYWCRLQLQDVVFSRASTSGSGDRNGRGIKRGK